MTCCGDAPVLVGVFVAKYSAALQQAVVCDPTQQNPCGVKRPLPVVEGSPPTPPTSLCWVDNVGYVTIAGAAQLDPIIAEYTAAGCPLPVCPGPAPHVTQCLRTPSAVF